jgi:hypothetical protein
MQISTVIIENNREVPQKVKSGSAICSGNPIAGYKIKEMK